MVGVHVGRHLRRVSPGQQARAVIRLDAAQADAHFATMSQASGSPRFRSRAAVRPSTSSRCAGGRPLPGRIERTLARRQRLARLHVGGDVERAAEQQRAALGAQHVVVRAAQRRPGVLAVGDQRGELGRLEAEGRVRAAVGAGQGEVLLDHAGAQRDRRPPTAAEPGVWSERPIGQPKRCGHVGDGAHVGVLQGGRIAGDAVQQHDAGRAGRQRRVAAPPRSRPRLAMPVEMISGLPLAPPRSGSAAGRRPRRRRSCRPARPGPRAGRRRSRRTGWRRG